MKYIKEKNKITILELEDFNINQILDCGQIFRYSISANTAIVHSKDKQAIVESFNDKVIIFTSDTDYFENFFDLQTDYSRIKEVLKEDSFLSSAIDYGYGIRILKNDVFEIIISFIISANNNIKRIKKSIETLCEKFGKNMGDYFAFPTLDELKKATIDDFLLAGLGYRSSQMFETVQKLTLKDIEDLKTKSHQQQFEFLTSLKGVGEKVANCILLFGFGIKNVFPVDTWINKVYNKLTNSIEKDRKKITRELTSRYKDLSGYAQQYFFYYFRDNNIN